MCDIPNYDEQLNRILANFAAGITPEPKINTKPYKQALQQQLYTLRIQRGYTQKSLAKAVNANQSVIACLESAQANPRLSTLIKIAVVLDAKLELTI